MNAVEFRETSRALDLSDDELAEDFGVSRDVIRGWAAGHIQVPLPVAKELAWRIEIHRREAALTAAGLEECPWVTAHAEALLTRALAGPSALERHQQEAEAHAAGCALCAARERYEREHLGPPPLPPNTPAWLRPILWIERIPAWARPAVMAAFLLGIVVLVRIAFNLPDVLATPGGREDALVAVLAAAGAGAAAGLAYSLLRRALRTRGTIGAYATGIVCMFVYMGAFALAFPELGVFEERSGMLSFAVVSLFFGLVVGHSWFRDPNVM